MPSLEILVEKALVKPDFQMDDYPFAVQMSFPPMSHREPSIWQKRFSEIGGVLFHIGEARFKEQKEGWFFAYDLLKEVDVSHFQFKPDYFPKMIQFLEVLIQNSNNGRIHFTSDVQFGPEPRIEQESVAVSDFSERHERIGIRFNSWITIVPDRP